MGINSNFCWLDSSRHFLDSLDTLVSWDPEKFDSKACPGLGQHKHGAFTMMLVPEARNATATILALVVRIVRFGDHLHRESASNRRASKVLRSFNSRPSSSTCGEVVIVCIEI